MVKGVRDSDYKVRSAAMDALRQLTKEKFDKPEEWTEWWDKRGKKDAEPTPASEKSADKQDEKNTDPKIKHEEIKKEIEEMKQKDKSGVIQN